MNVNKRRTYKVSKTRDGKPKITLYLAGRIVLSQITQSVAHAHNVGRAWSASAPVEAVEVAK